MRDIKTLIAEGEKLAHNNQQHDLTIDELALLLEGYIGQNGGFVLPDGILEVIFDSYRAGVAIGYRMAKD